MVVGSRCGWEWDKEERARSRAVKRANRSTFGVPA
jgi:hypothetical protein